MANPVGWNSAWGEYKAGVNDFSTQINKASTAAEKAAVENARNNYIDSQGGSVNTNGGSYGKTYNYTPTPTPTPTQTQTQSSAQKQSSAGNDYSSTPKYDRSKLPSAIDYNISYDDEGLPTGSTPASPKYGGQSNVTQAQYEKYGATTDPTVNSNLWWQVQNDQTLNPTQKQYLQAMLHEANQQMLSGTANFDSHTGAWTDKTSGQQVNVVTDADKNSYVADDRRNASTIEYTYKDGKYYYNGKEIQQVEFRKPGGSHVGLGYIIDGQIYIQQGNNWTAAPISSLDNTTGETFAIYDGVNEIIIPDSAWKSFTPKGEAEEETEEEEYLRQNNYISRYVDINGTGNVTPSSESSRPTGSSDFFDSEIYEYLNEQLDSGEQANVDAIRAAAEKNVEAIKAQLENGLAEYETAAAEAYLTYARNNDSLVLYNASVGNNGGIAQRQYDDQQAAYDSQLLTIALERQYFVNTCNQTIAQLEAEERYEEANAIADWAQQKINTINQTYQWYEEQALNREKFEYDMFNTDRNFAYTRAMNMLQNGMLTSDVVQALGVSASDAQAFANRINALANTNLEAAQAELQAVYLNNQLTQSKIVAADYELSAAQRGLSGDSTAYSNRAVSVTPAATDTGTTLPNGAVNAEVYDATSGSLYVGSYYYNGKFYDAQGRQITGLINVTAADGSVMTVNGATGDIINSGETSAPSTKRYDGNPAKNDPDMGRTLGNYSGTGIYQGLFGGTADNSVTRDQQKSQIYSAVDGMTEDEYYMAKSALTKNAVDNLGVNGLSYYYSLVNNASSRADIISTISDDLAYGRITEPQAAGLIQAFKITTAEWGGKDINQSMNRK